MAKKLPEPGGGLPALPCPTRTSTHWAGWARFQLTPTPTPSAGLPEDSPGWLGLLRSLGPSPVKGCFPLTGARACLSALPPYSTWASTPPLETSHCQEVLPGV